MSYTQIPIKELEIAQIKLDLRNYRIPNFPDDESGALSYLFASEDVLGTAKMILRDGYFDNEMPIVVHENNDYVVIEGNRRVSALKALNDPNSAGLHAPEIQDLLKRYSIESANLPNRIRVFLTPDRETAEPHIARLHTGRSKRPWTRDQQATFYYSLYSPSYSVDKIRANYPGASISRFMRMGASRRFLSGVKFSDPDLRAFAVSDDLKMSSLEYAYKDPELARLIGLKFDSDGLLEPTTLTPEVIGSRLGEGPKEALSYLLGEFKAKRLNTRSQEFRKGTVQNKELLKKLQFLNGQDSSGDSGESDDARPNSDGMNNPGESPGAGGTGNREGSKGNKEGGTGPKPTKRGPNHPHKKQYLDLTGLDYEATGSPNIKLRYHELRSLNLINNPAAAAMYVRSLLETSIKFYFERIGSPVSGELSKVIHDVYRSLGKNKHLMNSINLVRSGTGQQPGSISWFNSIAHSADIVVRADVVHEAWGQLNPLLRYLLTNAKPTES